MATDLRPRQGVSTQPAYDAEDPKKELRVDLEGKGMGLETPHYVAEFPV